MGKLVARERYDIVHVHTPVAGFLGRAALRGARSRDGTIVIYTAHGFHFHPNRGRLANAPFALAEKAAARWTDYLVVINDEDARAARRLSLVPPDRLVQMPGIGIDTSRFQPDRVSADDIAAVRSELGSSRRTSWCSSSPSSRSTSATRTRCAHSPSSATRAPTSHRRQEGPALEGTKRLVAELGLGSRVHWLGFRGDIPALIRASDVTVLLSAREGLPLSVLESLSLATQSSARASAASRTSWVGGDRSSRSATSNAAARAIRALLEHPEKARAAGEQGRRTVERFDVRHVIQMHDLLYDRALARRASLQGR